MALELRVDTDLQTALPAEIGFNFDELKTELAERLEHYNNLVVTEDGIKEAKDDRAKLNKLRAAIDTRRKDIKKEYLKPYSEFESKIKELTVLIDEPIKAIDMQLETYEERRKEAKMEKIQEAYEDIIPEEFKGILPLPKIFDDSWLNKTAAMKKVKEDLQAIAKRTTTDMRVIDGVEEEHRTAVKARYIATLDIEAAMEELDRLKEAQEAFRAREEAKKRAEEERIAREAKRAAEAKTEPQAQHLKIETKENVEIPIEQERRYVLRLEFNVTRDQAIALRNFIDQNNIEYTKI